MNTILAVDTSTEACSAAVLQNDQLYSCFEVCPREHNQKLLPMVENVLTQAGIQLDAVDYIVYGQGPGSFTGVRIATGIVQGLALGSHKMTYPVSSLLAMAYAVYQDTGKQNVIAAIDARMGEIYLAALHFDENGKHAFILPQQVCAPDNALNELDASIEWAAVGTGWQTYQDILSQQINASIHPTIYLPDAASMARIAHINASADDLQTPTQVAPLYVRDTVTWKKLPGR